MDVELLTGEETEALTQGSGPSTAGDRRTIEEAAEGISSRTSAIAR
jgi:hypothetical protein